MWAWENPSVVDDLKIDALKVRAYGTEHKIEKLTTAQWACEEAEAWAMTALACKLNEAQGAYRGPAGATYVFMTFGRVRLHRPGSDS